MDRSSKLVVGSGPSPSRPIAPEHNGTASAADRGKLLLGGVPNE